MPIKETRAMDLDGTWEGVTDKEIMRHRFSRKNVKKSTRTLAKTLGMELEEYEAACERAMEEEAAQWKEFLENI